MNIVIAPDGSMKFIVDDDSRQLLSMGNSEVRRASHVEPFDPVLRFTFHVLRSVFSDKGRVSEWTRSWQCYWQVNMSPSNGPTFGVFRHRRDALAAEVKWLTENRYSEKVS